MAKTVGFSGVAASRMETHCGRGVRTSGTRDGLHHLSRSGETAAVPRLVFRGCFSIQNTTLDLCSFRECLVSYFVPRNEDNLVEEKTYGIELVSMFRCK